MANKEFTSGFDFYKSGTDHDHDTYSLSQSYREDILQPFAELVSALSVRSRIVADVASGTGQAAAQLQEHLHEARPDFRVWESDISTTGLLHSAGLKTQALAHELPVGSESIAAIHFKDALVHFSPQLRVWLFNEFERVLEKNGLLLIVSQFVIAPYLFYKVSDSLDEDRSPKLHQISFAGNHNDFIQQMAEITADPNLIELSPPYFVANAINTMFALRTRGFLVSEIKKWTPRNGEKEWHPEPVPRFVITFKKK